jgi:hypothetical protein
MSGLWPLIGQYWKALGISVTSVVTALAWFYRKYKAKRVEQLDSRVLEALVNHGWTGNRPFTGAGGVGVRAIEMAEHLAVDRDEVADSFERLEALGKSRKGDGTLSDPAPYWFAVRR